MIRTFAIESKTYMYVIRTQRVNSFPAVRTATAKIPQAAHSGFYVHKKTQQYNKVTWLETTLFCAERTGDKHLSQFKRL